MTWREYAIARRYLTETRIGARVREAKRIEDAQAKANRENLQRERRR